MTQWFNFVTNHLYLWGGGLILIFLLLFFEFEAVWRGVRRFDANGVSLAMNRGAVVVDVEELADFQQGHILGATHLAFSQWPDIISNLKPYQSTLIILVAKQERKALQAAIMLQQHGFTELGVLSDGLATWKSAGLPLVKK